MSVKRISSLLLAIVMIFSIFGLCLSGTAVEEEKEKEKEEKPVSASLVNQINYKPKVINIVYDDSGSMVNGKESDPAKGHISRWAQAKYALEIFVSMMDDKDMLNVYTMSNQGESARLEIQGKNRSKSVKEIHNDFKTGDFGVKTPIQTLDNAYQALKENKDKDKKDQYDRWLIVITDGAFDAENGNGAADKKAVESKLDEYAANLDNHVIYIPIEAEPEYTYKGANFTTYDKDSIPKDNQKAKAADKGSVIRTCLLMASNQIYSLRDQINFNAQTGVIPTSGISMSKMIIFLQGDNVKLEGLGNDNAKIAQSIDVKYTEAKDAIGEFSGEKSFEDYVDKIVTDESLNGIVAIVEPKEEGGVIKTGGEMKLAYGDKTNITDGVVYYEPALKLKYSLTDAQGNVWLSSENNNEAGNSISPGDYILQADIIDAGTEKGNLNNNNLVKELALDVQLLGQEYHLEELQNGVKVHFEDGANLEATEALATGRSGKYGIDTSNFVKAFQNCVVKTTYKLVVDIQKDANKLDFAFHKTHYILSDLKNIQSEKDMLKATVKCFNGSKQVALTDEVWAQVVNAYKANNGNGTGENGASIYVGKPAKPLKDHENETFVDYDLQFTESVNKAGEGEFFIIPKYILNEKGKPDKSHTTHRNFIHQKYMCDLVVEINIPNVTDELAYSTTPTPIEQRSLSYIISISMWWTIAIIFLILWILGYIFKKKLPKKKYKKLVNTKHIKKGYDESGEIVWKNKRKAPEDKVKIRTNLWTLLLPWVTQKGTLDLAGLLPMKLEFKASDHSRRNVELKNRASEFDGFAVKTANGVKYFLQIGGDFLTEENIKTEKENSKKKKYIFNLADSLITFGATIGKDYKVFEISNNE